MPRDSNNQIARDPRAVETTVGSEIVLMMIQTGECIGLGEIGSEVWRQIAVPLSASVLVERLRDLYEAAEGVIEQDLEKLLDTLHAHHVISVE